MKLFTDYTNQWKGQADETRSQFDSGTLLSFSELKSATRSLNFRSVTRSIVGATQFKPLLPTPKRNEPLKRRISFSRDIGEVRTVAEYLFQDPHVHPSLVGEECFDIILKEAKS